DRVRFLYGVENYPADSLRGLEDPCRAFWANRGQVVERLGTNPDATIREDLMDLAIYWADLQVRLAPPARQADVRAAALKVLNEAEALFGPSPVLDAERRHSGGLFPHPPAPSPMKGEGVQIPPALPSSER